MRRLKKILSWFFISLATLVVMALLFTQTGWFRDMVRARALDAIHESINGTVNIGTVEGNLFSRLTLKDITFTLTEGDTLIQVDEIGLHYAPFYLLKNEIRVNSLTLLNPEVNLVHNSDSTWNFQRLLRQKTDSSVTPAPFSMVIDLKRLQLISGVISFSDANPLTPEKIDSLNLDLSGRYTNETITARLTHLGFKAFEPDLVMKTIRFDLDFNHAIWKIRNFYLATIQNQISADAGYQDLQNFSADVDWPSVQAGEFAFALPNITIPAHPDFSWKVKTSDNQLSLALNLIHGNESIALTGSVANLTYLLNDSLRHLAPVDLQLKVSNLVPNNWIEMPPLPLLVNTDVEIIRKWIESGIGAPARPGNPWRHPMGKPPAGGRRPSGNLPGRKN
jgi:translocation and assembly module TamB